MRRALVPVIIGLIVLAIGLAVGFYVGRVGRRQAFQLRTPTPTPTRIPLPSPTPRPTATPTPTPSPTITPTPTPTPSPLPETFIPKKTVDMAKLFNGLQVETPDQVAAQIRAALKYIPPERLVISTDCGMGREGMSRRHAFYKTVSIVLGTNMVRKELGFPQAECLAADERYSLVAPAK